ncbi:MAG: hypothetical protein GOU97_02585 [Nanoarchaeota archaeon]|nr:hypothetical protein [Nanoarchaeota archaeon]
MNIYQSFGKYKFEDLGLPVGTVGSQFIIESAEVAEKSYGDEDVVQMGLQESGKGLRGSFRHYWLIGEEVFALFMEEMNVDSIDDLVGRDVLAFIHPQDRSVRGLAVKE